MNALINRKFFALLMLIAIGTQSVDGQGKGYNGDVTFLRHDEEGTIVLQAYGSTRAEATKNALSILLFKGIPGSKQALPIIPNETEARAQHSDYLNKLLDGTYAKRFVLYLNGQDESVAESKKLDKHSHVKLVTRPFEIKIDYISLRKDLEQNGVLRKFGF